MKLLTATSANDLMLEKPTQPYVVRSSGVVGDFHLASSFVSVKMVLQGEERYHGAVGGSSVVPGRFLLAAAGDALDLSIRAGTRGVCAYFDAALLELLVAEALTTDIEGGANTDAVVWSINLPVNTSRFGRAFKRCALSGMLPEHDDFSALLAELIGDLHLANRELPHQRQQSKREIISRLETARGFILDHQHQDITLDDIAEAACLSKFHLLRQFATIYGLPPLRYHQRVRLVTARQRIMNGESISFIAEQLGFANVSSFSRAYQRCHGRRPSCDRP